MNFPVQETPEKLEACEDFSDDDEEPVAEKAEVRVSITKNEDGEQIVTFNQTAGSKIAYTGFVKSCIKEKL
jgi:hypothetical protein